MERTQSESLEVEVSNLDTSGKQYLIRMKLDFTDTTLVFVSVHNGAETPIGFALWGKVTEHNL